MSRAVAVRRDVHFCRRCGRPGTNVHHRLGRRHAWSDLPSALVTLCGSGVTGCHGYITEHPTVAYGSGWSIRHNGVVPHPSTVPLVDLYGRVFLLTNDGQVAFCDGLYPADLAALTPPF